MAGNNPYDGFAWRDYNELARLNEVEKLAVLRGLPKTTSLEDIHKKDMEHERQMQARNAGLHSAASWKDIALKGAERGQADAQNKLEQMKSWTEEAKPNPQNKRQK